MRKQLGLYFCLLVACLATPALAYIGPGVGAGVIAVLLGIIGSIFLSFIAILWYPVKRLVRRWKARPPKFKTGNQESNELDTDNVSLRHSDRDRDSHAAGEDPLGD